MRCFAITPIGGNGPPNRKGRDEVIHATGEKSRPWGRIILAIALAGGVIALAIGAIIRAVGG